MAALLVGAVVLGAEKIKEKRATKRAQKAELYFADNAHNNFAGEVERERSVSGRRVAHNGSKVAGANADKRMSGETLRGDEEAPPPYVRQAPGSDETAGHGILAMECSKGAGNDRMNVRGQMSSSNARSSSSSSGDWGGPGHMSSPIVTSSGESSWQTSTLEDKRQKEVRERQLKHEQHKNGKFKNLLSKGFQRGSSS